MAAITGQSEQGKGERQMRKWEQKSNWTFLKKMKRILLSDDSIRSTAGQNSSGRTRWEIPLTLSRRFLSSINAFQKQARGRAILASRGVNQKLMELTRMLQKLLRYLWRCEQRWRWRCNNGGGASTWRACEMGRNKETGPVLPLLSVQLRLKSDFETEGEVVCSAAFLIDQKTRLDARWGED